MEFPQSANYISVLEYIKLREVLTTEPTYAGDIIAVTNYPLHLLVRVQQIDASYVYCNNYHKDVVAELKEAKESFIADHRSGIVELRKSVTE